MNKRDERIQRTKESNEKVEERGGTKAKGNQREITRGMDLRMGSGWGRNEIKGGEGGGIIGRETFVIKLKKGRAFIGELIRIKRRCARDTVTRKASNRTPGLARLSFELSNQEIVIDLHTRSMTMFLPIPAL